MTDMDLKDRPRRRDDLEVVNRPGDHALFDPETGAIHALNATSMAIWEACDGETTVEELTDAIREMGGIEIDTARVIVQDALTSLRDADLIRPTKP